MFRPIVSMLEPEMNNIITQHTPFHDKMTQ